LAMKLSENKRIVIENIKQVLSVLYKVGRHFLKHFQLFLVVFGIF